MGLGQMKKALLPILVLALSIGIMAPIYAQNPNFGTVDTRILLILHPSMENFDYVNERFFRDTNPNKDITDTLNKLNEAQKKADLKNAAREEEIKRLQKESCEVITALNRAKYVFAAGDVEKLKKTKSQLESSIETLNKNYAPGKISVDATQEQIEVYKTKIAEIDALLKNANAVKIDEKEVKKHENRLKEIDKKIAECKVKQYENIDESMNAMYLTRKETEERLTIIKKDIKKIISLIAEKENCSIVIDNSFALRDPVRANRKVVNTQISPTADVTSTALFHSFTNYELTEEQAIKDTGIQDGKQAMNHLLYASFGNLEDKLRSYLQHRDYVPAKVADFTFGSMFISGGKDLTSLCAQRIFEKYNVPDDIRQRFVPVLKEYLGEKGEGKNE